MKRPRPMLNFRGLAAFLLLPKDQNQAVLERVLQRLGLAVQKHNPAEAVLTEEGQGKPIDIVFADADAWMLPSLPKPMDTYPVIALIGHETPTRLLRSHEMAADTFLLKPVRTQGVFTAIFFAINEHRQRRCLESRIADMDARHAARRHVIKAILLIMDQFDLAEDQAFCRLRQESMTRRLTIEDVCREIVVRADERSRQSAGG